MTADRHTSLTGLIRAGREVKIAALVHGNPAALWLTKTSLSVQMEITKEGAQRLRMKIPNARVVFERTHSYLRLLPACSKIARTTCNVKVGKTRLLSLFQLRAQEQVFN